MRKLLIVASAASAVLSLGAMRTAGAEAFLPKHPAPTHVTNIHPTTHAGDAFAAKRRPHSTVKYSTTPDRHARPDSDDRGSTATSHSVPSRVSGRQDARNAKNTRDGGRKSDHDRR
ncbi:MAG TPA: hypothetical protein VGJ18_22255 [Gemmatimonadaceae bacterium]